MKTIFENDEVQIGVMPAIQCCAEEETFCPIVKLIIRKPADTDHWVTAATVDLWDACDDWESFSVGIASAMGCARRLARIAKGFTDDVDTRDKDPEDIEDIEI